ncbi:hypothetical protein N7509_014003 [Penicillium cosmopolitanum]|uniref:Flavin-nucleotide-binding protein n=1 Tax=Penicillium cosmopolitanum TaxID=1131564 RepID=A0A9W9RZT1_9EURO|nr:uncharacterized protein N7509_014003 [Penicillium cosmopolitanum]KAJ5369391.1 hypothetical protein N7509_014003 [Penicillium cosmopolitanum]
MQPATLRRRKDQGKYDIDSLISVFADSFISHVAYVCDGLPQCLPMTTLIQKNGEVATAYLHGHPSSKLIELVRKSDQNKDNGGLEADQKSAVRVCITSTKVDGLVLSSAPNGHEFNYRSAVIHGVCSLVCDRAEKTRLMSLLTNHVVPDRWQDVNPVSSFQISLVHVIRVEILSCSIKTRSGIPNIQPRNIEKDGPDRLQPVWTGVVPLYDVLGNPIASGLTDDASIPPRLLRYVEERNESHRLHAETAASTILD